MHMSFWYTYILYKPIKLKKTEKTKHALLIVLYLYIKFKV
jgi:hypothetical protein